MRKIICDRCGKEIPQGTRTGYIAVNWRAASDNSLMLDNPYENDDFCEGCMKDIVSIIDYHVKVEMTESVIDADLEVAKEDVEQIKTVLANKKNVDPVQFRELLKDGKTMAEIAEHFQISKASAYKYKKAFEHEYNQGFTGGGVCGGAGNALHAPREVEA